MEKKGLLSQKMAFDLVAPNCAGSDGNTCYRQSMCSQRVLVYKIKQWKTFSNSIYPDFR